MCVDILFKVFLLSNNHLKVRELIVIIIRRIYYFFNSTKVVNFYIPS